MGFSICRFVAFVALASSIVALRTESVRASETASDQFKAIAGFHNYVLREYVKQRGLVHSLENNLSNIEIAAPSLRAIRIPQTKSEFVRDSAIINDGYESGGRLFFVSDQSPQMGIHTDSLFSFDSTISETRLLQQPLYGLFFSHISSDFAILQGFTATNLSKDYYWLLQNGTVTPAVGPGTQIFSQPQTFKDTCSVDSSKTIVKKNDVSFSELAQASSGVAMQPGISVHCRHIGSETLVWLTANATNWDGVTYIVIGRRLVPLFRGHPFIETAHFLVFVNYVENSSTRSYFFVHF